MHKRPAVIGVSAVSNLGQDWPSTWSNLLEGKRRVKPFSAFGLPFPNEIPVAGIDGLDRTLLPSGCGAACRLSQQVLAQLGVSDPTDLRLYGASNHSETDVILSLVQGQSVTPAWWSALLNDPVPRHAAGTAVSWVYSACTSSMHALVFAVLDCSDGECDDAVVLGVDALSSLGIVGFWRARGASTSVCSPFEERRDGILVGEGGAALRLTTGDAPKGSVRVLGLGMSCDAGHPTDPEPSGVWLELAITNAFERAGIEPNDVSAIVSHGTGTVKNDAAEAAVFRKLWPKRNVPVTSIKGTLGHTMGAAGLFNVLVAVEACQSGLLPPIVGRGQPSLEGLDIVRGCSRQIERNHPILTVASGFGGNNCAVIMGVQD